MKYDCITLLTDIGWEYAAQMKGVLHTLNPAIRLVDITHHISPQNIREGAFLLSATVPYFPQGIHVCVVDPGVGTTRRSILVECSTGAFVGPDNGVLIPAARRLGIQAVYHLTNTSYFGGKSQTFHGRDIFSPVAAHLSQGVDPREFGDAITDYRVYELEEPHKVAGGVQGKIVYIDTFGNIITNLAHRDVTADYGDTLTLAVNGKEYTLRFLKSYGYGEPHELMATMSSFGFLELSTRNSRACDTLRVKGGEVITLKDTS
jgi:S-adenosylmethionine hydrolase